MNKKAFTLLELLVAIVVIGLLLAILFPALGRVREAVRRAQCMNNLRQHGIAWYLYLDDHEEKFPKDGVPSEGLTGLGSFGGKQDLAYGEGYGARYRVLNKYLDIYSEDDKAALEIFHCPDDIKGSVGNPPRTNFDYYGNSYLFSLFILRFGSYWNQNERPLNTITSPRNKVYMEICNLSNDPGHGGKGSAAPKIPVMVLFVDGHVAGPFLFNNDYESYDPNTNKPVIWDPNGTENQYD